MHVVLGSPALVARLRTFGHEIETELAAALRADERFDGDAALTAALLVAAYRTVAAESVRRRVAGSRISDNTLTLSGDGVASGRYWARGSRPTPPASVQRSTPCDRDFLSRPETPGSGSGG